MQHTGLDVHNPDCVNVVIQCKMHLLVSCSVTEKGMYG